MIWLISDVYHENQVQQWKCEWHIDGFPDIKYYLLLNFQETIFNVITFLREPLTDWK